MPGTRLSVAAGDRHTLADTAWPLAVYVADPPVTEPLATYSVSPAGQAVPFCVNLTFTFVVLFDGLHVSVPEPLARALAGADALLYLELTGLQLEMVMVEVAEPVSEAQAGVLDAAEAAPAAVASPMADPEMPIAVTAAAARSIRRIKLSSPTNRPDPFGANEPYPPRGGTNPVGLRYQLVTATRRSARFSQVAVFDPVDTARCCGREERVWWSRSASDACSGGSDEVPLVPHQILRHRQLCRGVQRRARVNSTLETIIFA